MIHGYKKLTIRHQAIHIHPFLMLLRVGKNSYISALYAAEKKNVDINEYEWILELLRLTNFLWPSSSSLGSNYNMNLTETMEADRTVGA